MTRLPPDIAQRIDAQFTDRAEREEVRARLEGLWAEVLNVGPAQLARAVLVIAAGDISVVRDLFASGFRGDPRDVLVEAHDTPGSPGNYCVTPFDTP